MGKRPDPLFLDKSSYRRRRFVDAIKLVAFLGLVLWMIPVFWSAGGDDVRPVSMSSALLYIFGVWILLILLSAGLSRLAGAARDTDEEPEV